MAKNKKQQSYGEWIKENPWRAITIVLGIIVLALILRDYINLDNNVIGKVEISDSDLESFKEILANSNETSMKICDIEEKNCFVISKNQYGK